MEIKGILFDKDGTLIDFYKVWGSTVHPVIEALLVNYGLEDRHDMKKQILEKIGVHGNYIDPEGSFAWKPYDMIAEDIAQVMKETDTGMNPDPKQIKDFLVLQFQKKIELQQTCIPVLTDLRKLMMTLHKMGIQTGLVTTDEYEAALDCMKEIGIQDLITFYGTAGRQMPVKPDKELLYKAADCWNILPDEIAVVGDTPNDMRFAKNAGAIGIGVLSGTGSSRDLDTIADFIIDSVDDLLPFLEKMDLRR